jgi:hypothetical protein
MVQLELDRERTSPSRARSPRAHRAQSLGDDRDASDRLAVTRSFYEFATDVGLSEIAFLL